MASVSLSEIIPEITNSSEEILSKLKFIIKNSFVTKSIDPSISTVPSIVIPLSQNCEYVKMYETASR